MKRYVYLVLLFLFIPLVAIQAAPQTKISKTKGSKSRIVVTLKSDQPATLIETVVLAHNFSGDWKEISVPRFLKNIFIHTEEILPGEYEFNFQVKVPAGKEWVASAGKVSGGIVEVNGKTLDETFVTTDATSGSSHFSIIMQADGSVGSGINVKAQK